MTAGTAIVTPTGVAAFNRRWPCSELDSSRAYSFDFDDAGNLVDTDAPDGSAAAVMADDCRAFITRGERPEWGDTVSALAPMPDGAEDVSPDGVPFYVDAVDPGEFYAFALDADGETDGDNIIGPYASKADAWAAAMTPGGFVHG